MWLRLKATPSLFYVLSQSLWYMYGIPTSVYLHLKLFLCLSSLLWELGICVVRDINEGESLLDQTLWKITCYAWWSLHIANVLLIATSYIYSINNPTREIKINFTIGFGSIRSYKSEHSTDTLLFKVRIVSYEQDETINYLLLTAVKWLPKYEIYVTNELGTWG